MPQRAFTGLGQPSQPPLIQWADGYWRVWLSYNKPRTAGTYLVLADDGSITRVTEDEDETTRDIITVKPAGV